MPALTGLTKRGAYAGLARGHPWLTAALAISFLSFIGVPPLAGFSAKLSLFAAAVDAGYAWLAVLGVVNMVVSIFYYVRVLAPAYFDAAANAPSRLSTRAAFSALVPAVAVFVAGLVVEPFVRAFTGPAVLFP